jgi:outer membrane lipoprotein-sorting protein
MNARLPVLVYLLALPLAAHAAGPSASTPTGGAAGQRSYAVQSDAAVVERVQDYLNGLHTLKARFTQVAPDGAVTHGTAWLERPGRMRFQYDPPSPLLLVAGHGFVLFSDSKLGQTSNIPIGQTPLGILLAPHIDLTGGALRVTNIRRLPGELQLNLVRSANPSEGGLTLTFATDPLSLRQWTVTDPQQQRTTVTLTDVRTGGTFDPALFDTNAPSVNPQRGGGGAG